MTIRRQKNLTLSFSSDFVTQICAYGEAIGCETMQDAIRSLVALGLSMNPQDGIMAAAQQRAYMEIKKYTLTSLSVALQQINRDVQAACNDPSMLGSYMGRMLHEYEADARAQEQQGMPTP